MKGAVGAADAVVGREAEEEAEEAVTAASAESLVAGSRCSSVISAP